MTIGILGGTGAFGRALGVRLARLGEHVLLGSRSPHDEFVSNEQAAREGELVFLAVPAQGVVSTARDLAGVLAEKVLVSVASPVVFRDGRPTVEAAETSLAEQAAAAVPDARVVAGFHTVAAGALLAERPIDEDVLICGDDQAAKEAVAELAERIVSGRAIDAGRLEAARWLEALTAVLLNINRNYRCQAGIRITGL